MGEVSAETVGNVYPNLDMYGDMNERNDVAGNHRDESRRVPRQLV